jgi:anti-sigma regulatory factor (Ser/Thr protein kinase)
MPPPTTPPVPPSTDPHAPRPLQLRPEIGELPALVDYIEAFACHNGLTPTDVMAFNLAAEELFANTLLHSQPPATLVEFWLVSDASSVTGVYVDDAAPFDSTTLPEADITLPVEKRRVGGLGIHFIRRTMQTFAYRRTAERNVTTFSRTIGSRSD